MSEASTEDISRAVLDWVNSFNLTNQAESLKSLCDGVVISQVQSVKKIKRQNGT